jgi:hypothetical protein
MSTGAHTLTSEHHHTRLPRFPRLLNLFRGHDDLPEPPALDLQDDGDGTDYIEALKEPAPEPDGPPPPDDGSYWGPTMLDNPPQLPRRYAPEPAPEPEPEPRRRFTPLPPEVVLIPLPDDLNERMARITYPPPGAPPEQVAAMLCQVHAATWTATDYEQPRKWGGRQEWPGALPALAVALVAAASRGLHRAAIEAPAPALPDLRVAQQMAAMPGGVIQ